MSGGASGSRKRSPKVINANPDKRFFIEMLVKDIELLPAIVDLVDNSVDAARGIGGGDSFDGFNVLLEAKATHFLIQDNCAGIEAEVARKYAFRFGRPRGFKSIESSVGQFGIGMKRALFKLGDRFSIRSVAKNSEFDLDVNVPEWERNPSPDWTFEFARLISGRKNPPKKRGITIRVEQLHSNVREDFSKPAIINRLRREIAIKHQSALSKGLRITVNERDLAAFAPQLLASSKVKPVNYRFGVDAGMGTVAVQVVAGIARAKEREDLKNEADATDFPEAGDAGWYVYCNDRLVIAADRTELTGWGGPAAGYHPQYRRFRGYVFLHAENSALLPWNTTKTGLDQDSPVFRVVQQEMFRVLQHVQAIINKAKSERQTRPESERVLNAALETAREVPVEKLRVSKSFVAPMPPPRQRTPRNVINVQYQADRSQMERVMERLGVDSAGKAGLRTFEYFVDAELRD